MPNFFARLTSMLERVFLYLTRPVRHSIALSTLTDLSRIRAQLIAENALLRQQPIILQRQVKKNVFYPIGSPLARPPR